MNRQFRRRDRWNAFVCAVILLVMLALNLALVQAFPAERRIWGYLLFGGVWGAMSAMSIYAAIACNRYRLRVSSEAIEQTTFGTTVIALADIRRVAWNSTWRQIRVEGVKKKITIDVTPFTKEEGLWLIRFIRAAVSEELQDGWPLFVEKVARRLLPERGNREPGPGEIGITRDRYRPLLIPGMIVSLVLFGLPAFVTGHWLVALLGPAFFAVMAGLLYFSVSKNGEITNTVPTGLLGTLVLGFILLLALTDLERNHGWPEWTSVILLLAWSVAAIVQINRMVRRRKHEEVVKSIETAAQWRNTTLDELWREAAWDAT